MDGGGVPGYLTVSPCLYPPPLLTCVIVSVERSCARDEFTCYSISRIESSDGVVVLDASGAISPKSNCSSGESCADPWRVDFVAYDSKLSNRCFHMHGINRTKTNLRLR